VLLSLKAQQESLKAQVELAQADDNPQLKGRVEVAEYSREIGSNDVWRAGVRLDVPLFNGGRSEAKLAKQRAEFRKVSANVEQQRRVLRQHLLELWAGLQTLKVAQQSLVAERDYRDLYLDRSRAEYELEVTTDLGDAMVVMSALRYQIMKTKFSTALSWARVDAMLGRGEDAVSPAALDMKKGEKK
jgi:outer membrane protein TolC